jgi:hypothetical protein
MTDLSIMQHVLVRHVLCIHRDKCKNIIYAPHQRPHATHEAVPEVFRRLLLLKTCERELEQHLVVLGKERPELLLNFLDLIWR